MARRFPWATWSDAELLELRLKDLKVSLDGTWVEACLEDIYEELAHRGLRIRPHAWISDEWFSPSTAPGIAVPFYLTHPRLMRLERKKILDVEGGTVQECKRILRHEVGHVMQHAYLLHRRKRWQQLFGRSSTRYPKYYRPNPASKNYVQHLPLWYAQSHPDEDFAETFAVWLAPRSDWRHRYAGWPALKKLEYLDELMKEIGPEKPLLANRLKVDPINRLTQTLAEHYERKIAFYSVEAPKIYDKDLLRIFSDDARYRSHPAASGFLRRNRAKIRQMVSKWTGEYQLTLDTVFDEMIDRCRELKLRTVGPERQLTMDFAVLLTAQTVHSLYSSSRRQWIAV
jgi:hypothetical protein